MLLTILIALSLGLSYWQKPSTITKILSYVLAILAAFGVTVVSVFIVLSSSQIAPSVTYTLYIPLSYPVTVIKVVDSLNHVFFQAVMFLWPRGFSILGSGYRPSSLFNISVFDTLSFLIVATINTITALVFLILFFKWGIQYLPQRVPTDHIVNEFDTDEGAHQPLSASSQLLIRRAKRTDQIRLLLIGTGLILLLVGSIFIILPIRVPQGVVQEEFHFSPDTRTSEEVTIPFNFAHAVHVTVSFTNYSVSDDRRIGLGYTAGLITPLFGFEHSASFIHWINVTTVEFIFGLENSTLFFIKSASEEPSTPLKSLLFIQSLTVDVYYFGNRSANCDVTIVLYQNLLFVPGLVLLGLPALPLWLLVRMVRTDYRTECANRSKPAEATES